MLVFLPRPTNVPVVKAYGVRCRALAFQRNNSKDSASGVGDPERPVCQNQNQVQVLWHWVSALGCFQNLLAYARRQNSPSYQRKEHDQTSLFCKYGHSEYECRLLPQLLVYYLITRRIRVFLWEKNKTAKVYYLFEAVTKSLFFWDAILFFIWNLQIIWK